MLISGYRKGLFKVLDAVCILAALSITGWFMLPADLSVLDDYTGASLFTVVSYLFFFYVLDAYNVGAEDFKDTTGRVLIAFFLGAIASASAFYAFQHWRFDRRTLLLLFSLCLLFCLGWRALYYKHIGRFVHKARILLIGTDRAGKVRQTISESLTDADIVGYVGDCDNDREIPYLGTPMQVEEIAKQQNVTMIVLLPDAPIDEDIATELLHAKLHGQMIVDVRSFCEHMVHRLPVSQISSEWLLTEEGFSLNTRGSLGFRPVRHARPADLHIAHHASHRHCHPCGISRPRHLPAASRGPVRAGFHRLQIPLHAYRRREKRCCLGHEIRPARHQGGENHPQDPHRRIAPVVERAQRGNEPHRTSPGTP